MEKVRLRLKRQMSAWRWWLPPAAISLVLILLFIDPFIGDWDALEYTVSALRGYPSSMALGRSLFIFYNHGLYVIAHAVFNLPPQRAYLLFKYAVVAQGVLAVIAGSGIIVLAANDSAETVANLLEKATLTAHVIAPNAAAAVWQFDTQSGERILQSLASDPDFASGIIVDDKGDVFARLQNRAIEIDAVTPKSLAALFGVADPKGLEISRLHAFAREDETINVFRVVCIDRPGNTKGMLLA